VGGRPRELNATQPSPGLEKVGFELTSLVGGDGLRATEAGLVGGSHNSLKLQCFNKYCIARRHWIDTLMLRILNIFSNFKNLF
jgi:hypothetical protein